MLGGERQDKIRSSNGMRASHRKKNLATTPSYLSLCVPGRALAGDLFKYTPFFNVLENKSMLPQFTDVYSFYTLKSIFEAS